MLTQSSSSRPQPKSISPGRVATILVRERVTVLGLLVFASVMGFWVWRLRKGVDLSDESFYITMPLRFALGDRPFLDERGSTQGAGILTAPLVFLHHLANRNNSGLVLYLRGSYLVYLAGVGAVVAGAVRTWISRGTALACGALVCFFAPYSIYQFSYNTVGAVSALLASAAVLRLALDASLTDRNAKFHAVLAGVGVACSALAYPTMAVLAILQAIHISLFGRRTLGALRTFGFYVLGGVIVLAYVGLFFLTRSGIGSLKLTYQFITAWGTTLTNDLEKAGPVIEAFKDDWFLSFLVAFAMALVAKRYKPFVFVLAYYVPHSLALSTTTSDASVALRSWTCLGLFAPIFSFLVDDRRGAFKVMSLLWLPGLVVGVMASKSSGNGGTASGLGGFACMIAGAIVAARACEEACGRWRNFFGWLSVVAPVTVIWTLVTLTRADDAIYRDGKLPTLTEKVRVGPYKGLLTTEPHRELVEQLHTDVVQLVAGTQTKYVLFFPDFMAAYLSSNARGAIAESWLGPATERNRIDAELFREKRDQVRVVGVRSCPSRFWSGQCSTSAPQAGVITPHLTDDYEIAVQRKDYILYRHK